MLCCSCFSCNKSECEEPFVNNSASENSINSSNYGASSVDEVINVNSTSDERKFNCPSCNKCSESLSSLQKHLLDDHKELYLRDNRFFLSKNTQLHILTDAASDRHFLLWTDTNNSEFSCMILHLVDNATPTHCAVTLTNFEARITKTTISCFICNHVEALEKVVRFDEITTLGSPEHIECRCEFEYGPIEMHRCFAQCHVYGNFGQYVQHLKTHKSFPVFVFSPQLHVDENVYFMVAYGVVFMCVVSEDGGNVQVGFDERYKGCFTVRMRESDKKSKLLKKTCCDSFVWYCFEWHSEKYVIKVVKIKYE